MKNNIKVDIEELMERLSEMQEDGYITARLTITSDTYMKELVVQAYSMEEGGSIDYGNVAETEVEIIF